MKFIFRIYIFIAIIQVVCLISQDVILQKLEVLNDTLVEGEYRIIELKVSKYNRSSYVINSEMELLNAFDNSYSVS